jgi:hypothetical protein
LILYLHRIQAPYVEQMPEWATTTIVVVRIYGVFVWLIPILQGIASLIRQRWRRAKRRELIRHELETLNREDAIVLFDLVDRNQSSFQASMLEDTVSLLVARRLVNRAPGYFNRVAWPHTIDEDVWACMKAWVLEQRAAGGDPRLEYIE